MRILAPFVTAVMLVLVACGNDDATSAQPESPASSAPATEATPSPAPSPTATIDQSPSPRPGTTITTAASEFGEIVFDDSGQAIYLFDLETTSEPECYDDCAEEWPPVLTEGDPVAAGGVEPGQLGTTPRTDGTVQVTYAGHPLYYYAHEGVNEVKCHNVRGFGGLWLVVTPNGTPAP
jgi:predicted lipoprotein with Yx(FWY)xxD motif